MKIFFSVLLSIFFLNSFSQSDSVEHKFTIGLAPLLFVYPFEDGFYFEYQPKEKISFELGGGIYNLINNPLLPYKNTTGFTIRTATKFYINNKDIIKTYDMYFEVLCFYREIQYKNNWYYEDYREEATINFGGDPKYGLHGYELKQVIGLELLLGNKYFFGKNDHWIFENFFGIGYREQVRNFTSDETYNKGMYHFYNPPMKQTIVSFATSFHLGIKFGYSF